MVGGDVLNKCQTYAPSRLFAPVALCALMASIKVLKNLDALFFCDGIAAVMHLNNDAAMGVSNMNRHRAGAGAIFHRIVSQVFQSALH